MGGGRQWHCSKRALPHFLNAAPKFPPQWFFELQAMEAAPYFKVNIVINFSCKYGAMVHWQVKLAVLINAQSVVLLLFIVHWYA